MRNAQMNDALVKTFDLELVIRALEKTTNRK